MATRTYVIKGKVQGVGFRKFAVQIAADYGLTPTAHNKPDGSVEVTVTGDRPEMVFRAYKSQLAGGPPGSDPISVEEKNAKTMANESLKNKAALIIDNGSFTELAYTLAESYAKVYYFSSWVTAFPQTNAMMIGTGAGDIERVNDYWHLFPEVDLVVFPDLYYPGLQVFLEKQFPHLRVWGGRWGETLETDRDAAKTKMTKLGIEVGKWTSITGLSALREYLKHHKNKWVKISETRGDMETFFSKNYDLVESVLDDLEQHFQAAKETKKFHVEDDLPDSIDIAADIYSVDGQFPTLGQISHEVKDRSCVGRILPAAKWPKTIRDTNDKLSATFKRFKYRQFFAAETRQVKNGTGYVNDPACRMTSPPGGSLLNQYTNIAEILWHGAAGECIDPVPEGEWNCTLIIYSEWAEKNWLMVQFPEKIRNQVKLKQCAIIDGKYYVVPQTVGLCEIGEVCATGATLDEAREKCQEYGDRIEGHKVKVFKDALDEADAEIEKLAKYGIKL
jgi:acylphosphatase